MHTKITFLRGDAHQLNRMYSTIISDQSFLYSSAIMSHLSLLLNDGVSPDQLSIFVLNLFPVCLYRGTLVN